MLIKNNKWKSIVVDGFHFINLSSLNKFDINIEDWIEAIQFIRNNVISLLVCQEHVIQRSIIIELTDNVIEFEIFIIYGKENNDVILYKGKVSTYINRLTFEPLSNQRASVSSMSLDTLLVVVSWVINSQPSGFEFLICVSFNNKDSWRVLFPLHSLLFWNSSVVFGV